MSQYKRIELSDAVNESGMVEVKCVLKGVASHREHLLSLVGMGAIYWSAVIQNGDATLLARRSKWSSPTHKDTHYSALLFASETDEPVVFQGKLGKDSQDNTILDVIAYRVRDIKTYGFEE